MGKFLFRITPYNKELYGEWSTIVDAPVTFLMSLGELKEYIEETYGMVGLDELPSRLARIKQTGTSSPSYTIQDLLNYNRAGKNESHIKTEKGLYKIYYIAPR